MGSESRRAEAVLTPLELQIMQALWDGGPGSVAQVQARLGPGLAYTTVQTMLGVLLKKQRVRRAPSRRAHVYRPAVRPGRGVGSGPKGIVRRMFGGPRRALPMA